ncbi:MAG: LPS export ABC transporter periplasmic protein LptC [Thermodesulfobacteriota bacterium]|nr:LPS export ABC transporter periplasmic protein LptC [Thermodesulfobacteriota bacterium]
MKLEQRYLFWILAGILFLIVLWRPWQQNKSTSDLWTTDLKEMKADLTFEGIRYTRNIGEKIQWILKADVARLYEDKNIMDMEKIRIKFFPTGGGHVIVTADSCVYRINNDEMLLNGDVKIHSEDGSTLFSETMCFSQKKKLIWTSDRVVIKGDGLEMEGKGLEYDLQDGKLTVKRQTAVLPENGGLNL